MTERPSVYALPPGVDFAAELVRGLVQRYETADDPAALSRVTLVLNTERMARRVRSLFAQGPARLLPRVHLVTRLPLGTANAGVAPPESPLRRRLELVSLIGALLDLEPDLAPRSAIFDLADSLANLSEEMQGEGVSPEILESLDVNDLSGHWQRSLRFLTILKDWLAAGTTADAEGHRRRVVKNIVARWRQSPPAHPIILAGSTGSRGTTLELMRALARVPNGAVVLPGFDFDMPGKVWEHLTDALTGEDHPQFRFARLLNTLDMRPEEVRLWTNARPPAPDRNRVISLSLRPAPVTHQWRGEGKDLPDLRAAFEHVTLLEAPGARQEALAIAARLRKAVEDGQRSALITPDRMLTRRVAAALDKWNILPDDSAGTPLHLTPPGRLLRHVASILTDNIDSEMLVELLKHPLTHSGAGRNRHLLRSRNLELVLRRNGIAYPNAATFAEFGKDDPDQRWADWLAACTLEPQVSGPRSMADLLDRHISLAERLCAGAEAHGSGALWDREAGREVSALVAELRSAAESAGRMTASDYASFFERILSRGEVRNPDLPHPLVRFLGTLESRVNDAELVILGSLNDGTWPGTPQPDPWLNRQMRHEAGLLLPERQTGLSAHDYQQAIAAKEVWLTRSTRSDESETVPSRWLNRLTNLLDGLPVRDGPNALDDMRRRGGRWLEIVDQHLDAPIHSNRAPRPSPAPPAEARPRALSVTQITRLRRDPYAVYARHVLGLKKLEPLRREPDMLMRGTVLHDALERFVKATNENPDALNVETLLQTTSRVLSEHAPWAATRVLWHARMARVAEWFVQTELVRRLQARPIATEAWGELELDTVGFKLTAKADRIDLDDRGRAVVYDYKTGSPPSQKAQLHFDRQLLLESAMVERGAFATLGTRTVIRAEYIGLSTTPKIQPAPLDEKPTETVLEELAELIRRTLEPAHGFTSRRAMSMTDDPGDYDHLARYGEWDEATPANVQRFD